MTRSSKPIRLAADIGGTFTDIALAATSGLFVAKVPTNAENPELGVLAGVEVVLKDALLRPEDIDVFIHGTTLATNALIERKGVKTALITTEGFRDSIEIAYESRFDQFDLMIDKPEPLVPRSLRYTVRERMSVRGDVLIDLDAAAASALARRLNDEEIEAAAVGFIHSYANPDHERLVRDILESEGCKAGISLSSDVCPEVREYERLMTTVCNAYVQPIMAGYLRALESALSSKGFGCPLYLMTSGGGMTTLENAVKYPIRLVESGPSGGAILAAKIAMDQSEGRALSFDMGGTTAKISLIEDYGFKTARSFEIARSARFKKGSGMPVRIPVVEMIEIGAGGGSIAHVDDVGRLSVGPHSAGAAPGAACYRKGGTRPTVTDADLLLGRIDPDAFAEGKMALDVVAAQDAIDSGVCEPLAISGEDGAFGIMEMVDENMANAARIHAVEHGADLSAFTMIAFGGSGPLHALRVAEKLGIARVIVPANSGVGSAVGFLGAPISYEVVQSLYMTLSDFDLAGAAGTLERLSSEARSIVCAGARDANATETRGALMRYLGQGHEIQVPLPSHELTGDDVEGIKSAYDACYRQLYGRTIPERDIEILSWSVTASVKADGLAAVPEPCPSSPAEPSEERSVFVPDQGGYLTIPAYWRPDLKPGNTLAGPALVEEPQTTTFVTPAFGGRMDGLGNLILDRIEA